MTDIQGYLETVQLLPASKPNETGRHVQTESQKRSVMIVLVTLGFMYSVHNLIAPNMTALAKTFHFDNFQRDAYIGGELTLFFYFPGVFGSLLGGLLSGLMDRVLLLTTLSVITGVACLLTARVATFNELAGARAMTGFAIGGLLPVVYSLIGDWFPAKRRASATAYVTAAGGAGVFLGQCIATITGSVDWRWPFLIIAIPSLITSVLVWKLAQEPARGGQEDGSEILSLHQNTGLEYEPTFTIRHFRALMTNKTNLLVILQAFPGNIPWGVIIVYIHDFLVEDLGLSRRSALGAIATLAASAFFGVLTGGFVGELLYASGNRHLAIFGGVCNTMRALPFLLIFGWKGFLGPLDQSSMLAFYLLLMMGGFVATMASPCTGAMLLNVNLPQTRGSVIALYSVLDDFSKGFGTLFVSIIVKLVGGRALAYQLSLSLWVFTGLALLYTWYTIDQDEEQMKKTLDETARESMVLLSKRRAQEAIRDRAKAAGQTHFVQSQKGSATWREQLLLSCRQQVFGTAPVADGTNMDNTQHDAKADVRKQLGGSTSSYGTAHLGALGGDLDDANSRRLEKERRRLAVKAAAQAVMCPLKR